MPRIDHVAVKTPDPDATAGFYERVLGARIVKTEGHPVVACDPDGRRRETITYRGGADPRRP
jgi:catechol 2,3-dioxygenase-like lactoylglutathione lyase family enzyme